MDEHDGALTLAIGLVVGFLALVGRRTLSRRISWVAVFGGGAAGFIALHHIIHANNRIRELRDFPFGSFHVGIGLHVLAAGAVICFIAGLVRLRATPSNRSPSEDQYRFTPLQVSPLVKKSRRFVLAGAATIVLGSFLTWVMGTLFFPGRSVTGLEDGDGIRTLVIGVVTGLLALTDKPAPDRRISWIAAGGGVIAGLTACQKIADVNFYNQAGFNTRRVEIGVYVVMVGAVICTIGGVIHLLTIPSTEPPGEDQTGHTPAA
jgi:hypothetical protein